MERRVSEQERRSRRWWTTQIVKVSVAIIVVPIVLLWGDPTQEEVLIMVAAMAIGAIGLILSIRELRRLSYVYRFEDAEKDKGA